MEVLTEKHSENVAYRDRLFRFLFPLVAAHYSLAINEPEPFLDFIRLPQYPLLLLQNWVLVFILVNVVYYVALYLDRKFPWHKGKTKRLILQLGMGVVLPSFLVLILAFGFFKINGADIFETNYLKLEWWFSILFIVIVNCYYIIYHFVSLFTGLEKKGEIATEAEAINLVFIQGSHKVRLTEEDIALFVGKEGLSLAHTFEGTQYLVEKKPLSEIMLAVPSVQFFRVSRSFIVNRDAINSFIPASSRRLRLYLNSKVKEEVYVSQRNVQEFKKWNNMR